MNPVERLGELLQAFMTVSTELRQIREVVSETRQEFRLLQRGVNAMEVRLARLEAERLADRSYMETELTRFKLEVERAELRLLKALPPSSE